MSHPMLAVSLVMVGALALVVILIFRKMLRGWLRRDHSQGPVIGALPPLPDAVGAPITSELTGLYAGSALVPERLDRVAASGLRDRSKAVLSRYPEGIMLKRSGARPIWIPDESIIEIRAERVVAGKVAAPEGILAIRWRLPSGAEIDTGFRGDDRTKYENWLGEVAK